jgi:choice-of-anchor C domain-containing protein
MSAVLLAIGTAGAATFTNGSFESASVDPADFFIGRIAGDTSITGWRVDRDDIDYIGGYWQASNGVRSIDMDGVQPGSISQTFDTVTGARYEVGFDMAGNPDGPPTIKRMQVSAGNDSAIFEFDVTGHSRESMGYQHHLFFFTAIGSSSTLSFSSLSPQSGAFSAFGAALDNVTVALFLVPEPALPMILCAGILLSIVWRRLRSVECGRTRSQERGLAGLEHMRTRHMRAILVSLIALACQITTWPARAALNVLNFDDLPGMPLFPVGASVPPDSQLSDQFLSSLGVRFSSGSPFVAVVELGLGHATSGVNGIAGSTSTGGSTFERSFPIVASFFDPKRPSVPATTDFVSLRIDQLGDSGLSVTLNAFDLHGALIDSFTTADIGGATLRVSGPGIHSVEYLGTHDSGGTGVDDFSFDPVSSIPEPGTRALFVAGITIMAAAWLTKVSRTRVNRRSPDTPAA